MNDLFRAMPTAPTVGTEKAVINTAQGDGTKNVCTGHTKRNAEDVNVGVPAYDLNPHNGT